MGIFNSNSPNAQTDRFETILEGWKKALAKQRQVVLIMDSNIDTYPLSKHHKRQPDKDLYNRLLEFTNENNIKIHNNAFTRYAPNSDPSVIDHVFSNIPAKLTFVETLPSFISDHWYLKFKINIEIPAKPAKLIVRRDYSKVDTEYLRLAIENNQALNQVFNYLNPNIIGPTIINEFNNIVENRAPAKIIQVKKITSPF